MALNLKKAEKNSSQKKEKKYPQVIVLMLSLIVVGLGTFLYIQAFMDAKEFAPEGIHMGSTKAFWSATLIGIGVSIFVAGNLLLHDLKTGAVEQDLGSYVFGMPAVFSLLSLVLGGAGLAIFSLGAPSEMLDNAQESMVGEAGYENVSKKGFEVYYGEKGDKAYIIHLTQKNGELYIEKSSETEKTDGPVKISK